MDDSNWMPWFAAVAVRTGRERDSIGEKPRRRAPNRPYVWQPAVDLFESRQGVVLRAELPGVPREAINVEFEGGELLLYGQRPPTQEEGAEPGGNGMYHMLERMHGPFARKVALPEGLDLCGATAVLRNGLLTVTIPRAADCGSRRIPIG